MVPVRVIDEEIGEGGAQVFRGPFSPHGAIGADGEGFVFV